MEYSVRGSLVAVPLFLQIALGVIVGAIVLFILAMAFTMITDDDIATDSRGCGCLLLLLLAGAGAGVWFLMGR
jgi:hypothetical protein